MAAAPRIFEKVYNVMVSSIEAEGGAKLAIFRWAVGVGKTVSQTQTTRPGTGTSARIAARDRRSARVLEAASSLRGRFRYFVSRFSAAVGGACRILRCGRSSILEGYGLTESSASTFVNPPGAASFGSVGPPIPGTEVRIADDGEVLIESRADHAWLPRVPGGNRQHLCVDGWLQTGDIGVLDRGSLSADHRPQERADQDLRWQVRGPGQARGIAECRISLHLNGPRPRRSPQVLCCAGDPRSGRHRSFGPRRTGSPTTR